MRLFNSLLVSLFVGVAFIQPNISNAQDKFGRSIFLDAKLFVDTLEYSFLNNALNIGANRALAFEYIKEAEVAEVYLFFDQELAPNRLALVSSADFTLVDSILIFDDYARFKVRFNRLTESDFLKFIFRTGSGDKEALTELPLYPYTKTYAKLYSGSEELYIGEEKEFEFTTNNVDNIKIDNRWTEDLPINYRVTRSGDKLFLHILPNTLGKHEVKLNLSTHKPYVQGNSVNYSLPEISVQFHIRSGRLAFLQFDIQEVTPKEDKKESIEIQLDNDRSLKLGKTYRIEDQEEEGGALIAELYTKARLNNDRVLCLLRPYAYHRKSEGYLYIKEGDEPRFVTNVDITPKTSIETISIQREGKDWQVSNKVYPGEIVSVKLEGEGLHKASFSFPGASDLKYDSLIKNENISIFQIKVPLTINTNNIEIFNHNKPSGKSLRVTEYQRPRTLDFVTLDLGDKQFVVNEIEKPIYYESNLTDLVFDFNQNKIDQGKDLYGRQYLNIKVKISNKKGNLIELYQFDEVIICPGESSPRYVHYDSKNCKAEDINLNNFISKKTSDLEEWSRIELEISHIKDQYGGEGKTKKIQIHLKRDYNFDIDVSFPAGLLILKAKENDFTNFGGVSFAMIAQFSFYEPGKIAKPRPYKVGAGFIAIDAFNFSDNNNNRDVALVVIGSLYPTSSDNKLTFPLYAGMGYLLTEQKPFFLIGPGIRVRL
ncbi:MAG: hypothetical protein ACI83W_000747 [Marinoscillum sp.]|jgi:hypothetical protein